MHWYGWVALSPNTPTPDGTAEAVPYEATAKVIHNNTASILLFIVETSTNRLLYDNAM